MTMVKADRIASLKKVKILSEIDILTGAKNRNCFEKNLVEYNIRECSSIAFIYIDVNGLHTMNNKFGHSEGDKMLKTVTREIIKEFGSQDTYRIGGDEFVVFAFDKEAKEISVLLQLIKINLEKNGYYISTGFSIHKKDELNIDKIVLEAEQEMYKEKENYYKLKGEDVR